MTNLPNESTWADAVMFAEKAYGDTDIKVASALADLASFYAKHGKIDKAQACNRRIHEILEFWFGDPASNAAPVLLTQQ